MTHPDAPVGATPADNKVIKHLGRAAKFDFKPKDHVALAEALDLVDFEAGAAVAGQKFYFLKNEAVLLELALVQYAMRHAAASRATRRSSRRTWPASRCSKASASCRAARRRRSTPSRTPTCA